MSRENIEALRRSFDALERGDLAGVLDSLSESVELRQPPEFPGADTAHGHEGYLKARAELEEAARAIRYEAQELIDAGDQAIAVVRFQGHARYTDLPIDVLVYWSTHSAVTKSCRWTSTSNGRRPWKPLGYRRQTSRQ